MPLSARRARRGRTRDSGGTIALSDPDSFEFTDPQPWAHQREAFLRSAARHAFSYEMEQRTGKSRVAIDKARYMHGAGEVDAVLIAAMPGRVHRNWVVRELPAWMPPGYPYRAVFWESHRARQKSYADELDALLRYDGLAVLAVNGEAMITDAFRSFLTRFYAARRRVLAVLDEYTLVCAAPGAKRTILLGKVSRRSRARLIMDGTPGENPFDLFAPYRFLDPAIHGFTEYTAFKHRYGRWTKGIRRDQNPKSLTYGQLVEYPTLDRGPDGDESPWQNLDELKARLDPHRFRVLFRDVFDSPAPVYQTVTFRLTPRQRRVYDDLRDEYEAELRDGTVVTAAHVLVRYLRLQQVASNYWPSERTGFVHEACGGDGCPECEHLGVVVGRTPVRRIDQANPRLEAFLERLPLEPHPGIVWTRFHQDAEDLMGAAREAGRRPVRYDGTVGPRAKDAALEGFQAGEYDLFVGSPAAGGRGIRLDRARWIAHYSHYVSLLVRLQGEVRAESAEKRTPTGIVDFAAEDTVDDTVIVPALRAKKGVMDYINGDRGGRWL